MKQYNWLSKYTLLIMAISTIIINIFFSLNLFTYQVLMLKSMYTYSTHILLSLLLLQFYFFNLNPLFISAALVISALRIFNKDISSLPVKIAILLPILLIATLFPQYLVFILSTIPLILLNKNQLDSSIVNIFILLIPTLTFFPNTSIIVLYLLTFLFVFDTLYKNKKNILFSLIAFNLLSIGAIYLLPTYSCSIYIFNLINYLAITKIQFSIINLIALTLITTYLNYETIKQLATKLKDIITTIIKNAQALLLLKIITLIVAAITVLFIQPGFLFNLTYSLFGFAKPLSIGFILTPIILEIGDYHFNQYKTTILQLLLLAVTMLSTPNSILGSLILYINSILPLYLILATIPFFIINNKFNIPNQLYVFLITTSILTLLGLKNFGIIISLNAHAMPICLLVTILALINNLILKENAASLTSLILGVSIISAIAFYSPIHPILIITSTLLYNIDLILTWYTDQTHKNFTYLFICIAMICLYPQYWSITIFIATILFAIFFDNNIKNTTPLTCLSILSLILGSTNILLLTASIQYLINLLNFRTIKDSLLLAAIVTFIFTIFFPQSLLIQFILTKINYIYLLLAINTIIGLIILKERESNPLNYPIFIGITYICLIAVLYLPGFSLYITNFPYLIMLTLAPTLLQNNTEIQQDKRIGLIELLFFFIICLLFKPTFLEYPLGLILSAIGLNYFQVLIASIVLLALLTIQTNINQHPKTAIIIHTIFTTTCIILQFNLTAWWIAATIVATIIFLQIVLVKSKNLLHDYTMETKQLIILIAITFLPILSSNSFLGAALSILTTNTKIFNIFIFTLLQYISPNKQNSSKLLPSFLGCCILALMPASITCFIATHPIFLASSMFLANNITKPAHVKDKSSSNNEFRETLGYNIIKSSI